MEGVQASAVGLIYQDLASAVPLLAPLHVIYLRITGRAGEGQPAAGSVWVERGLPGAAAG